MARERKYTVGEEIVKFNYYADKAPTSLQVGFADWLIENMGLEFATGKAESAFREGVRLGTALRMQYQRSPENKEREATEAADREEQRVAASEEAAERKEAKAAARAESAGDAPEPKRRGRPAAAAEKPAAAKPGRRTVGTKPAAPAAGTRKPPVRRRAGSAKPVAAEADF
jgi:hypothetical protein